MNTQTEKSLIVYQTAKALLGLPLAQNPVLGCVETANFIFKSATGTPICNSASTVDAYKELQDENRFMRVCDPLPGDVIVSPTGMGNGKMPHGHIGIVAKQGVMSNSSETGRLELNYTLKKWTELFYIYGGFPIYYYRVK
jgi:hypothetical protein